MALMTDRVKDGEDCLGSGLLAEAAMVKDVKTRTCRMVSRRRRGILELPDSIFSDSD